MTMVRLAAIAISIFLAAPLLVVVPMSFSTAPSLQFPPPGLWLGYYAKFFADPNWTGPLVNSIIIGGATAGLTMAVAVPASFALVRHRFPGRSAFNLLLMTPLIVPHIVMALGYYVYFGELRLLQSYLGVVLAHTCFSIPVAMLIITAALKGFDLSLERAAMSLGARPLTVFRLITMPILAPAFVIAGLFAFVHSFDETVISLFISGRDVATLPRQMFNSFRMEADPVISVASSLLFAAALAGVLIPTAVRSVRRTLDRRNSPLTS
jgi:putative spermidine/putrescine transport system permease protein